MKKPQCYFYMKLRLDRTKTAWLFISVKLKTQRNGHTICCISVHVVRAQKKCHLAEIAYQNVTNIKICNWDNIL